jgi:hypothetical protein
MRRDGASRQAEPFASGSVRSVRGTRPRGRSPVVGASAVACVVALGVGASGCYRYAYHERSAVGPRNIIAVDRQQVVSHTAWSYFWGLRSSEWTPDPERCEAAGAGRVEVGFRWFSVPLMLLTLGIVAPTEMVVFCNVDNPPGDGP